VKNPDGSPGFTWNPFVGCLHGCSYCYARKIALRFCTDPKAFDAIIENYAVREIDGCFILDKQVRIDGRVQTFPFGFVPTFHRYRLEEPLRRKKPSTIFVNDMSDIMGEWFQSGWIKEIIAVMKEAKQHTFLLLTKNPKRYFDFGFPDNCWLGQTLDGTVKQGEDFSQLFHNLEGMTEKSFISFEPLIGNYFGTAWNSVKIIEYVKPSWVIVGAQTKPFKLSSKQDVIDIVSLCKKKLNIPVFMKDNLNRVFDSMVQEFPVNYIYREKGQR